MNTDQKEKRYWLRWYLGVFLFLVFQIIIYYLITKAFN